MVGVDGLFGNGKVHISTDYGKSWKVVEDLLINRRWHSVAISHNGQYMALAGADIPMINVY